MNRNRVTHVVVGVLAGGLGSIAVLIFVGNTARWKWAIVGILVGGAVGLFWPVYKSIVVRLNVDDWRLEEVEIQGLKFTSGGLQRRVAWRLFVEMASRIATQPLQQDAGDDGAALASLHHLFGLTRDALTEMEPTQTSSGETVETYALDMLNSDLRPFLAKWHPQWEEFVRTRAANSPWARHEEFRSELKTIQKQIESRARGLAQIARVKNVDRFFKSA